MGTTQGQRTPDSVGEVAACPRDMCCMGTASGGSTSRPTAAPSASGRLKGPFSVWPPRQILVCHSCQAARGQIPSRTSRVARAHCHGNPWSSTVSRSPTVRSCFGSGCLPSLGVLRFYHKWAADLGYQLVQARTPPGTVQTFLPPFRRSRVIQRESDETNCRKLSLRQKDHR